MQLPSNGARPRNIYLNLKSLPGHFSKTFGGLPEQHEDSFRRRLNTVSDPEPGSSVVLQHTNDAQPTASESSERDHVDSQHLDYAEKLAAAQRDLIIILTLNRASRMFTILVLGFWGGWSFMPAETKCPDSVAWVTYICVVADW